MLVIKQTSKQSKTREWNDLICMASVLGIVVAWYEPLAQRSIKPIHRCSVTHLQLTSRLHDPSYPRALEENQVETVLTRSPKYFVKKQRRE